MKTPTQPEERRKKERRQYNEIISSESNRYRGGDDKWFGVRSNKRVRARRFEERLIEIEEDSLDILEELQSI